MNSTNLNNKEIEVIIAQYRPLVRRIANQVQRQSGNMHDFDDLEQIGILALFETLKTGADIGPQFPAYARMRVRGAMMDNLRKTSTISRSAIAKRRALLKCRNELEQQRFRSITSDEMAAEMNMDAASYHQMEWESQPADMSSIDDIYHEKNSDFVDDELDSFELLEKKQLQQILASLIGGLKPREAQILQLYFVDEYGLEEIGTIMGVGSARICQIKKAALNKLKNQLHEKIGNHY
ncbi:hypothetical protein LPB140_02885 [Sphingorhabdus lutea]|uniref:FliA/WhiG family RNA polymerase sigma factor n=1 Tax=Sphingorhabdus lutea TaxID=1913578 RepID=A0A1L3JEF5_9SPHN|nr:hypothetical protein LPB140_02885 [Sphingorhabdus lutea]